MSSPSHTAVHAADAVAQRLDHAVSTLRSAPGRLRTVLDALVSGNSTTAQFSRFVVVGGLSSALYAVLFVAVDGFGDQPANLVGAIGSTLLANELHRRMTFQAGGRVGWVTAQVEGGGLAVVGLVATSLALAGFQHLFGTSTATAQLLLIGGVTGLIGLVRFVALRAWVFGTSHDDVAEPAGGVTGNVVADHRERSAA